MGKKLSIVLFVLFTILFLNFEKTYSQIGSKNSYHLFVKGVNFYQKGEKRKALEYYEKAYENNKRNIILLKELATVNYEFENFDKSIYYFEKALKLDKSDNIVRKNLIYLYYKKQNYKKARQELSKLDKNIDNDFVGKITGYILLKEFKILEAYQIFKTVNIQDFDYEFYKNFIICCQKLNKTQELYKDLILKSTEFGQHRDYIMLLLSVEKNLSIKNDNYLEKLALDYILKNPADDDILFELFQYYKENKNYIKAENIKNLISHLGKIKYNLI